MKVSNKLPRREFLVIIGGGAIGLTLDSFALNKSNSTSLNTQKPIERNNQASPLKNEEIIRVQSSPKNGETRRYPLFTLLAYGFWAYFFYQIYRVLFNRIHLQGFKEDALSEENLKKREKDLLTLQNEVSSIGLFKHIPTLANYALPAVVHLTNNPRGGGSGFIFSSNGLIVTNSHIVGNSKKIQVTLYNGEMKEGEVIGTDRVNDLAVVKIEGTNLPTLKVTESPPEHGELVMAIGHPNNFGWSTTVGVLSGNERVLPSKGFKALQTDTAISFGNSGGPLLNMKGEVVGLNQSTLVLAQNLNFSVPASIMQEVIPRLIAQKD